MHISKVNNENHYTVQGWMVKELGLSGNDLNIYAIIYGFSQDGQSKFTGSLQYLADWTNSTKQGCSKNLKNLIEQELIIKTENIINNIKLCSYAVNIEKVNTIKQSLIPIKQSLIPIKQSLTNNINNNIDNSKLDKSNLQYIVEDEEIFKSSVVVNKSGLMENVKCIIDYLNESIDAHYRFNTKGTVNIIKARFKEGYKLDDFYDVIDKKVREWKNTEFEQYLRPSTLFGNKFENYLNQKVFSGTTKTNYGSKPTFDNTANHIMAYVVSKEEYEKLDFKQKQEYLSKLPIANMTKEQKEFFNKYCLAKDENGNLYKF